MFEYDGKQYEMKINTNRIKMVEGATKIPVMAEWSNNNGMLSLNTVEVIFQLCLKEAGADSFVSQRDGLNICHEYMNEHGYGPTVLLIQEALQRDLPFLFLAN